MSFSLSFLHLFRCYDDTQKSHKTKTKHTILFSIEVNMFDVCLYRLSSTTPCRCHLHYISVYISLLLFSCVLFLCILVYSSSSYLCSKGERALSIFFCHTIMKHDMSLCQRFFSFSFFFFVFSCCDSFHIMSSSFSCRFCPIHIHTFGLYHCHSHNIHSLSHPSYYSLYSL